MNNQEKLLSYILNGNSDTRFKMIATAIIATHFAAPKSPLPYSKEMRVNLSTLLGILSQTPASQVFVSAFRSDEAHTQLQRANVSDLVITRWGNTAHEMITSRHLEELGRRYGHETVANASALVTLAVLENHGGPGLRDDFDEILIRHEIAVLTLLVVAAVLGHSGSFSLAKALTDMLSQVDILGRDKNGAWIVVAKKEAA